MKRSCFLSLVNFIIHDIALLQLRFLWTFFVLVGRKFTRMKSHSFLVVSILIFRILTVLNPSTTRSTHLQDYSNHYVIMLSWLFPTIMLSCYWLYLSTIENVIFNIYIPKVPPHESFKNILFEKYHCQICK